MDAGTLYKAIGNNSAEWDEVKVHQLIEGEPEPWVYTIRNIRREVGEAEGPGTLILEIRLENEPDRELESEPSEPEVGEIEDEPEPPQVNPPIEGDLPGEVEKG